MGSEDRGAFCMHCICSGIHVRKCRPVLATAVGSMPCSEQEGRCSTKPVEAVFAIHSLLTCAGAIEATLDPFFIDVEHAGLGVMTGVAGMQLLQAHLSRQRGVSPARHNFGILFESAIRRILSVCMHAVRSGCAGRAGQAWQRDATSRLHGTYENVLLGTSFPSRWLTCVLSHNTVTLACMGCYLGCISVNPGNERPHPSRTPTQGPVPHAAVMSFLRCFLLAIMRFSVAGLVIFCVTRDFLRFSSLRTRAASRCFRAFCSTDRQASALTGMHGGGASSASNCLQDDCPLACTL